MMTVIVIILDIIFIESYCIDSYSSIAIILLVVVIQWWRWYNNKDDDDDDSFINDDDDDDDYEDDKKEEEDNIGEMLDKYCKVRGGLSKAIRRKIDDVKERFDVPSRMALAYLYVIICWRESHL